MRAAVLPILALSLSTTTCAPPVPAVVALSPTEPSSKAAIAGVLDDFHAAAAHADEARYFGHFTSDAVFLGTDATERWSTAAFRAYAHPHFAKGKAWSFRAIRREITVDRGGALAWFDEDLETPNLGPARGSGVLSKEGAAWKIRQYNLAITVPNERFDAVKQAVAGAPTPAPPPAGSARPRQRSLGIRPHVLKRDRLGARGYAPRILSHFEEPHEPFVFLPRRARSPHSRRHRGLAAREHRLQHGGHLLR